VARVNAHRRCDRTLVGAMSPSRSASSSSCRRRWARAGRRSGSLDLEATRRPRRASRSGAVRPQPQSLGGNSKRPASEEHRSCREQTFGVVKPAARTARSRLVRPRRDVGDGATTRSRLPRRSTAAVRTSAGERQLAGLRFFARPRRRGLLITSVDLAACTALEDRRPSRRILKHRLAGLKHAQESATDRRAECRWSAEMQLASCSCQWAGCRCAIGTPANGTR